MPFAAGHKLATGGSRNGAGRKPDALKRELKDLLDKAVPQDKRLAILEILSHMAHAGNVKAATFLFDRMYGKPVQTLEIADSVADEDERLDLSKLSAEELKTLDALMRKAAVEPDSDSAGASIGEGADDPGAAVAAGPGCGAREEQP